MTAEDQGIRNDGGLNTLAEAQDVPPVEGDGTCYQLECTDVYSYRSGWRSPRGDGR